VRKTSKPGIFREKSKDAIKNSTMRFGATAPIKKRDISHKSVMSGKSNKSVMS